MQIRKRHLQSLKQLWNNFLKRQVLSEDAFKSGLMKLQRKMAAQSHVRRRMMNLCLPIDSISIYLCHVSTNRLQSQRSCLMSPQVASTNNRKMAQSPCRNRSILNRASLRPGICSEHGTCSTHCPQSISTTVVPNTWHQGQGGVQQPGASAETSYY